MADAFLLFDFGAKYFNFFRNRLFVYPAPAERINRMLCALCICFFFSFFQEQIGENSIATRFFVQSLRV